MPQAFKVKKVQVQKHINVVNITINACWAYQEDDDDDEDEDDVGNNYDEIITTTINKYTHSKIIDNQNNNVKVPLVLFIKCSIIVS